MAKNLHEKFIDKLVEKYGAWEKVTSKFGSHSFGKIAEDLCISNSQFSKLIAGTATEGNLKRNMKNESGYNLKMNTSENNSKTTLSKKVVR